MNLMKDKFRHNSMGVFLISLIIIITISLLSPYVYEKVPGFFSLFIVMFYGYFYYKYLNTSEKENLRHKVANGFVFILLIIPLLYIFVFIHELSHAIAGIFFGYKIESIFLNYHSGYVTFSSSLKGLEGSIITIAGSLGLVITGLFIITILSQIRRIKPEYFLPLMGFISFSILDNIEYWVKGAQGSDAWLFLQLNPSLDPNHLIFICALIKNIVYLFLIILFSYRRMNRNILFKDELSSKILF